MYSDQRVCMSICLYVRISKATRPKFTKFSSHVVRGRSSVLLQVTTIALCTSGFVDDVTFCCTGLHGGVTLPQQSRRCVAYVLTLLAVYSALVASRPRRRLRTSSPSSKPWRRGGVCDPPFPCYDCHSVGYAMQLR